MRVPKPIGPYARRDRAADEGDGEGHVESVGQRERGIEIHCVDLEIQRLAMRRQIGTVLGTHKPLVGREAAVSDGQLPPVALQVIE